MILGRFRQRPQQRMIRRECGLQRGGDYRAISTGRGIGRTSRIVDLVKMSGVRVATEPDTEGPAAQDRPFCIPGRLT